MTKKLAPIDFDKVIEIITQEGPIAIYKIAEKIGVTRWRLERALYKRYNTLDISVIKRYLMREAWERYTKNE